MATPQQDWDAAFYEVWKGRFIPKVQGLAPVYTGTLARSIQPLYRDGIFRIRIRKTRAFYWRFLPQFRRDVARLLRAELPIMVAYANDKAGVEFSLRAVSTSLYAD